MTLHWQRHCNRVNILVMLVACCFNETLCIRSGQDINSQVWTAPSSDPAHIVIWCARPNPEVVRRAFWSDCRGVWKAIWAQSGRTPDMLLKTMPPCLHRARPDSPPSPGQVCSARQHSSHTGITSLVPCITLLIQSVIIGYPQTKKKACWNCRWDDSDFEF